MPANDAYVVETQNPLSNVPSMRFGSMPRSKGFTLTTEERERFIKENPFRRSVVGTGSANVGLTPVFAHSPAQAAVSLCAGSPRRREAGASLLAGSSELAVAAARRLGNSRAPPRIPRDVSGHSLAPFWLYCGPMPQFHIKSSPVNRWCAELLQAFSRFFCCFFLLPSSAQCCFCNI